jgi:FolB domain-containing protein
MVACWNLEMSEDHMDRIFIKDLLLRGIIGVNDDERVNKQDILINVDLYADTRRAGESDNIEDAMNYRTISKRIIRYVEESADYLVEKLVADIARIIITEFGAERVRVRAEKPGALRYARSVGVEIERDRADYQL